MTGVDDGAEPPRAESELGGNLGHSLAASSVAVHCLQCPPLLRWEHEQHPRHGRQTCFIAAARRGTVREVRRPVAVVRPPGLR